MSELHDRLEALANRGTSRGADAVLSAALRDADAPAGDLDSDGGDLPIVDDQLPFVTLEPGARRRRFGSFVAAAGIAALVGVGALAISAVFGSGGAGSPEGAVRQLADAISHKDPLAAVDVLVPSEVRSLRETVHAATQRAADLKIVSEASQPLAGVDLSVDHLQLSTEQLADGYVKVTVTSGEISASSHRAQLSALLQKALRNGGGNAQGQADLTKLAASSGLPTFVIAVRQDGRWYVSPAYTGLEYAREINGGPPAAFGSAHAADLGAGSPEAAVSDALHAWQSSNWDRLMALAPPDELPVYDYRAWIDKAAADTHPNFTINTLSTSATVDGDTAVVKLDASGTMNSDPAQNWQVGGTCPNAYRAGGTVDSSTGNNLGLCLAGDLGQVIPVRLIPVGSSGVSDSGAVSIEVVRENGRWFVSPVTTLLQSVDAAIEHIDQRGLYTLLGLAYELPPDGTITLDQAFQIPPAQGSYGDQVFAFDGTAGEKVVGEASAAPASQYSPSAYGLIYTANGDMVGQVYFQHLPSNSHYISYISSTTLPVTGSYRLVLQPLGTTAANDSLTLWDLAHAPKGLSDLVGPHSDSSGGQSCTYSPGILGGTESCTAIATRPLTATPTTAYAGASSSGSSSSQSSSATSTPVAATTSSTPGP